MIEDIMLDFLDSEVLSADQPFEQSNSSFTNLDEKIRINSDLTRQSVSFQHAKKISVSKWFRYKEAFSSSFVDYVFDNYISYSAKTYVNVLDPFAGTGTVLTCADFRGWSATGIELLPCTLAVSQARIHASKVRPTDFLSYLGKLKATWNTLPISDYKFTHVKITEHAFAVDTEKQLSRYHTFLISINEPDVSYLFWFAAMSVLEDISFTRKDGQYLRWDHRSLKATGSVFSKGAIPTFFTKIIDKLEEIGSDMLLVGKNGRSNVRLINGSCLNELKELDDNLFDLVVTSPPYCNRYDYTRTYALELAYMGYGEQDIRNLRQNLLSATVENRSKEDELSIIYGSHTFKKVRSIFEKNILLHKTLSSIKGAELNNKSIPKMIWNYFFEMSFVIYEISRVINCGGRIYMVNDNVQYGGHHVPVDIILSGLAQEMGLNVDVIWTLPRGKGNSSQQMERHGRNEIRKCVYVWSKAT